MITRMKTKIRRDINEGHITNPHIRPEIEFSINQVGDGTYNVTIDRKSVMAIVRMGENDWIMYPWFGTSIPVTGRTVTEAISKGMNFFKCFVSGDGTFSK